MATDALTWGRVMTNTTHGHNKWYYIGVESHGEGPNADASLIKAYGPIGSCHKIEVIHSTVVYSNPKIARALFIGEAEDVMHQKRKKGYEYDSEHPSFEMIAKGDPKKLLRLITRMNNEPGALRVLRGLLKNLSEEQIGQISTQDLKPLILAQSKEARLIGIAMVADLSSRRRAIEAESAASALSRESAPQPHTRDIAETVLSSFVKPPAKSRPPKRKA